MGIQQGLEMLHFAALWPSDTNGSRHCVPWLFERSQQDDSDTPAREWWAFLEGENRDRTARGTPSLSAWWRSAAPTTTAMMRSAARPPTRNLRMEGVGAPSNSGDRDSVCQIIRHHRTEGAATPSSSGGSSCQRIHHLWTEGAAASSSGCGGGSGCQQMLDYL